VIVGLGLESVGCRLRHLWEDGLELWVLKPFREKKGSLCNSGRDIFFGQYSDTLQTILVVSVDFLEVVFGYLLARV